MVRQEELDPGVLVQEHGEWPVYEAERGEVLLQAGAYEGASVVSLGCTVRFVAPSGQVLAEAPPGAVAGAGQVLWRSQRMAHSVVATEPGEVLVVPREVLAAMRHAGDPLAAQWERYALGQLYETHRALVGALEGLTQNQDWRAPKKASWLDELMQAARFARFLQPPVDTCTRLRECALFADASDAALDALAPEFQQTVREAGMELYEQNHLSDAVHLVVGGAIELARARHGADEPAVVATAGRGALLGVGAALCAPTLETAVASERSTLLSLPADRARWLVGQTSSSATAFRIAMLRGISEAMSSAEARVVQLFVERAEVRRAEAAAFMAGGRDVGQAAPRYRIYGV